MLDTPGVMDNIASDGVLGDGDVILGFDACTRMIQLEVFVLAR